MNLKPIMRLLCHQKEDRTYKICNEYLLVCSRCLGIYAGFLFSFLILIALYGFFTAGLRVFYALLLLVPMGIDGTTQLFGFRESNNRMRFITGYLAGFGLAYVVYVIFSVFFFAEKITFQLPTPLSLFALVPLPILLFVLRQHKNNYFLKKSLNGIAVLTAVFLVLCILLLYGTIAFFLISK